MSDEHLIDYTQLSIDNGKESMPTPESSAPHPLDSAWIGNDSERERMFSYITGKPIEWPEI